MFADNTLTPKEAVRVCALGTIASAPMRYSALAASVRHFCSRVSGPSLDLMGISVELLRLEGLVKAIEGQGMEDDALLAITDAGRSELQALLTAPLRPSSDLTKLVVALKFRFLRLLGAKEQARQIDLLEEMYDSELARLQDLAATSQGSALKDWLDHDIAQLCERIAWLESFRRELPMALPEEASIEARSPVTN
jgi:DNA-binding PadR family transcriptional regulator